MNRKSFLRKLGLGGILSFLPIGLLGYNKNNDFIFPKEIIYEKYDFIINDLFSLKPDSKIVRVKYYNFGDNYKNVELYAEYNYIKNVSFLPVRDYIKINNKIKELKKICFHRFNNNSTRRKIELIDF